MMNEFHQNGISILPINKISDLSKAAFDCGVKNINDFLRNKSLIDSQKHITQTTVVMSDKTKEIISFFSLSIGSMETQIINAPENMNLFQEFERFAIENPEAEIYDPNLKKYYFPVIKLDFLAVNKKIQSEGIGTNTLKTIFQIVLSIKNFGVGFLGLRIDALYNAKDFYHDRIFRYIEIDPDNVDGNYCPNTCPMLARVDEIEKLLPKI
ncbi:hypothetical protein [Oenococcus oeni]|uniref:hypothetical protein n=1 Tax=Oenococcus oeni TaxID=1247 RepID=UPI0010B113ED|nr:hypothetical protein [Oenococcus oeni]SYW19462.1 hypothetical protein OENI_160010 [Oenococcus oeni]